jgi:hypothetical protein
MKRKNEEQVGAQERKHQRGRRGQDKTKENRAK